MRTILIHNTMPLKAKIFLNDLYQTERNNLDKRLRDCKLNIHNLDYLNVLNLAQHVFIRLDIRSNPILYGV